ncbi:uncharacterized protein LOC135200695 [Macrobrachium nipponense]|uniref:uncharacterized protein LOC135200695 n=1 Tax=Macrobrachium nipponense TaxID=159736 RepID=UPI0030C8AE13
MVATTKESLNKINRDFGGIKVAADHFVCWANEQLEDEENADLELEVQIELPPKRVRKKKTMPGEKAYGERLNDAERAYEVEEFSMAYYREYEDYSNQREYDDRRGYDKNRGYDNRRDSNNRGAGHRSPHRKMMSREKAKNILDVEARFRDFWYLDNGEDNRDRLQDAIDVVYNTVPGNDYVIDYMECQNSCRLKVKCLTCNVELTGYDPFITHEKGKPHKKVRQQIICIKDPNIKAELTKQPHNLMKGIFEPNSLEDMIDHCKETILGVHFLYKEVRERPYFTCTLCLKRRGARCLPSVQTRCIY